MTKPATFRKSDLERAVRVALDCGLEVAGFEIDPTGRIIVRTTRDREKPMNPVEARRARRGEA